MLVELKKIEKEGGSLQSVYKTIDGNCNNIEDFS